MLSLAAAQNQNVRFQKPAQNEHFYRLSCRAGKIKGPESRLTYAFLAALTLAHLARCAAAILRRAAIDKVRLGGVVLGAFTACDPFRSLAHLACCARAIRLRETADTKRFG